MARGFRQGQGRFANGQPVVYRENPAEVSAAVAHSEAAARSQAEERDRRLREAQAAEEAFVKIAMQVRRVEQDRVVAWWACTCVWSHT